MKFSPPGLFFFSRKFSLSPLVEEPYGESHCKGGTRAVSLGAAYEFPEILLFFLSKIFSSFSEQPLLATSHESSFASDSCPASLRILVTPLSATSKSSGLDSGLWRRGFCNTQNITAFGHTGSGNPSELPGSIPSRLTNPVLRELNYQHLAQKGDPKELPGQFITVPKKMFSAALYSSGFSLEVSLCYQIIWAN